MNSKAKRVAVCGLLTALALVLSLVERLFPLSAAVPVPGIKLGLANVVTLFALTRLGKRDAFAVLLVRVVLASVFMGSVTSFLFALFGGVLALAVMALLLPFEGRWFSIPGISAAGAAAHNIGQIGAAMLVLRSVYVAAYLPLLLVSALVMGLVTGLTCRATLEHLEKISF
ncbi:MAG: Gx transporter family protein [Clostridiaceae bacterium]|jgi:heptaprenyl diphosphate synthase|nr:Gx transporter family protein [Clostridiaceae bacterium]NBH78068.1 Gx transporter family protein [Clostridiaceae bacterium]NBI84120.1 Gx transporter family protein [Clostridiaceae bacterium]